MRESVVFCSTCTMSSLKKFTFAISSADELLVILRFYLYEHWMTFYTAMDGFIFATVDFSAVIGADI